MKKGISMLAAFVVLAGILTACGNSQSAVNNNSASEKETQTYSQPTTESAVTEVSMNETSKGVMEYFASIVNVNDYEVSYGNNSLSLTLKNEKTYDFTTDIVLDGSKITLPCDYNALVNAGWSFAYDFADNTVDGSGADTISNLSAVVSNSDGKEIWVTMSNSTAKALNITECTCTGIDIATANKKQEKNDKACDFETSSIKNGTSLKTAINALGYPSTLTYDEETNVIQANYNKNDGSNEHLYISYFWKNNDEQNIMKTITLFLQQP